MHDQQVRHEFHDAEVHQPNLLLQRHCGWPFIAEALNQGDEDLVHPTRGIKEWHDKGPGLAFARAHHAHARGFDICILICY